MAWRRAAIFGSAAVVVALIALARRSTEPPAIAPQPNVSRPSLANRVHLDGVENVGEVAPGIFRGAQPTAEGYVSLKKLGVRTVVSLRSLHSERDAVIAAGLKPIEIPLVADLRGSRPPSAEQVERFLATILDPANQPVFFHCAHGQDRTGTMCAVFRMEACGWTPEQAFEEMESFGFNHIWTSLAEFVKAYRPTGKWAAGAAPVQSG